MRKILFSFYQCTLGTRICKEDQYFFAVVRICSTPFPALIKHYRGFLEIFKVLYSTLLHLPPLSEDAGIESRTIGTLTLMQSDALTTKLDLIHDLARAHTII
jgi:hypothetical protein